MLLSPQCETHPQSPQLSSGDTVELHLQGLFLSQVPGTPVALLLGSLVTTHDAISADKEGEGKKREQPRLFFGGKKWGTVMVHLHALCWLRDSHPNKRVGQRVQFINFGGRGRLTGLVLTWIMMDHQERAQQNLELNQTRRVSLGINVGQVLSSQSDPISI